MQPNETRRLVLTLDPDLARKLSADAAREMRPTPWHAVKLLRRALKSARPDGPDDRPEPPANRGTDR